MPDLTKEQVREEWQVAKWFLQFHADCPESEVEELANAMREDWNDKDKRNQWLSSIVEWADKGRELMEPAKGITKRIKQSMREEKKNAV